MLASSFTAVVSNVVPDAAAKLLIEAAADTSVVDADGNLLRTTENLNTHD